MLKVIRAIRIAIGSIIVIAMGLTIVIGLASCNRENNLTPVPASKPPAIVTKKVGQISYSYNGNGSESENMARNGRADWQDILMMITTDFIPQNTKRVTNYSFQ